MSSLGLPFLVNALLAIGAYALRWLTFDGAVAALLTGLVVWHGTGLDGWLLLMMFFLTANILGKISRLIRVQAGRDVQKKGSRRDWAQVLANGSLAAASALFHAAGGEIVALVMFGSAVAASTADTWAGEAGILSRTQPVSIVTFKRIPAGLSGGVSLLGTFSGMLGSILIATAWYGSRLRSGEGQWFVYASIVAVSGIVGMLVDSLLGATLQGQYHDSKHDCITEHDQCDGVRFALVRGVRWIDNDVVNFLSNVVAVGFGALLALAYGL